MEATSDFLCVLASSSLWLTGSGLILWLCLRNLRLSPGTRTAASILVLLQGWIWIGIPVQIGELAQLEQAWNRWRPAEFPYEKTVSIDAAQAPDLFKDGDGRRPSREPALIDAAQATTPPLDSPLPFAARFVPELMRMAGVFVAAVWLAGIALIFWRSLSSFVALSRIVHTLPLAPAQWQHELSALCVKRKICSPLALKVSNVAAPMLFQTWGRACIVVPTWLWESCTVEQRTSILLHELAHYQRRDIWRQLAVRLLVLPHWFNPVAWWAARQFEAALEAACDEAACGGNSLNAIGYAKALLILSQRAELRYAPALSISGGSLTERIRRVLSPEFQKESQMSRFLILSALILLAGLAAIRIQAADPQAPTKNETAKNETAKKETAKNEPAGSNAASLLPNGGFEELSKETGEPASWYATRIPYPMDAKGKRAGPVLAGHYLMSTSPTLAHGGKRCVMVAVGDNHPDLPVAYNWTTDVQGWKAGETYELSGWLKVENAKQPAFIMVQFWGENEEKKSSRWIGGAWAVKDSPVTGDKEWTKVSTRFTAPEGTTVLRLRAGLSSEENHGAKAWLDDLALVKVASN
jgi:beta-lactamase regulating signal transducer with metallopeptidase domain